MPILIIVQLWLSLGTSFLALIAGLQGVDKSQMCIRDRGCNGNEPADIGEVSGVSDASRTADSEGSTTQETEDDQAESSSANMPGESNNDEHSNQTPHKTTSKTTDVYKRQELTI